MQLPAIQYGDWETVKKRMARVVTQLKRGADFIKVMTAGGMLDTEATPGLLSMFGIITGPRENFHCFMPWRTFWDAVLDEDEPSVRHRSRMRSSRLLFARHGACSACSRTTASPG